jgi:hypothetical protein
MEAWGDAEGAEDYSFSAMQARENATARRNSIRVSALKEALESRRQNELRQAQEILALDGENAELYATIEQDRRAKNRLEKELAESEMKLRVKERNFNRKLKLLEAENQRLQKLIELRTTAAINSKRQPQKHKSMKTTRANLMQASSLPLQEEHNEMHEHGRVSPITNLASNG